MALTNDQLLIRIETLEKDLNTLETALVNLAEKKTLSALNLIRQKEIEELKTQATATSSQVALLQSATIDTTGFSLLEHLHGTSDVVGLGTAASTNVGILATEVASGNHTHIFPSIVLDVTDYGALGNGTTDDTSAIQATLNAAEAGDSVYLPAGIYLVDTPGGIDLTTSGITLFAFGATIKQGSQTSGGAAVTLTAGQCTVRDIRFDCYDPGGDTVTADRTIIVKGPDCSLDNLILTGGKIPIDFQSTAGGVINRCVLSHSTIKRGLTVGSLQHQGIRVSGSTDVTLMSCHVAGYGEGINITSLNTVPSQYVQVLGGSVRETDDNGIYLPNAAYCSLTGVIIHDNIQHGIETHGSGHVITGCVIESTQDQQSGVTVQGEGTAVSGFSAENVVVQGCTVKGPFNQGIRYAEDPGDNGSVRNPTIQGCAVEFTATRTNHAFVIEDASDGARVIGNSARGHDRGLHMVGTIHGHTNTMVQGNNFGGAKVFGMRLEDLSQSIISGNITNNIDPDALQSSDAGILLDNSTNNEILFNRVDGTGSRGFEEQGTSANNRYINNVIGPTLPDRVYRNCDNSQIIVNKTFIDLAMSSTLWLRVGEYSTFILDPNGTSRNVNPTTLSGELFTTGYSVTIYNVGGEILTFDSAGIADAIAAGTASTYIFDGSTWILTV